MTVATLLPVHNPAHSSDTFFKAGATRPRSCLPSLPPIVFIAMITAIVLAVRNVSICYSGWAWHYTHSCPAGQPHPWAEIPPPVSERTTPAPRIAITMVVDNFLNSDLRNATIENKRIYARHWGYDLVVPNVEQVRAAAAGLPSAWAKFPVLLDLLDDYDYVLMIDADAVFLRLDIGLHGAAQQMERDNTSVS